MCHFQFLATFVANDIRQSVSHSVKQSVSWPEGGLNVGTFIFAATCCCCNGKLQLRQIFIHIHGSKYNFCLFIAPHWEAVVACGMGGKFFFSATLFAVRCGNLFPKNQLTTTRNLWHLCKKRANKCSNFGVAYKAAGLSTCNVTRTAKNCKSIGGINWKNKGSPKIPKVSFSNIHIKQLWGN